MAAHDDAKALINALQMGTNCSDDGALLSSPFNLTDDQYV
jgi:hypothetical protein